MAAKPKFIEPNTAQEELPKWMKDGQKLSIRKAKERIRYLTAIAQKAVAGM